MTHNNGWEVALQHYGSQAALRKVLGVSRQAVNYSIASKDKPMPAAWAAKLHRDSDGAVHVLVTRPDLYSGIVR